MRRVGQLLLAVVIGLGLTVMLALSVAIAYILGGPIVDGVLFADRFFNHLFLPLWGMAFWAAFAWKIFQRLERDTCAQRPQSSLPQP